MELCTLCNGNVLHRKTRMTGNKVARTLKIVTFTIGLIKVLR